MAWVISEIRSKLSNAIQSLPKRGGCFFASTTTNTAEIVQSLILMVALHSPVTISGDLSKWYKETRDGFNTHTHTSVKNCSKIDKGIVECSAPESTSIPIGLELMSTVSRNLFAHVPNCKMLCKYPELSLLSSSSLSTVSCTDPIHLPLAVSLSCRSVGDTLKPNAQPSGNCGI